MALLVSGCGEGGSSAAAVSPSVVSPTPTPTPTLILTPTPTPTPTPVPTQNTQSINVVFIGGSITEGIYAGTPEKSYAGLLTAWLGTRYPQVSTRNIGLGGTGSEFANYRLDRDLGAFTPDLAILEFTVNDAGEQTAKIAADIDAIAYRLRARNPRVKIIYVSTTDRLEEPERRAGRRVNFVEATAAAIAFDELTYLDVGAGLWSKVIAGAPVATLLRDSVHPTDVGGQLYFEQIRDLLAPQLPLPVQPSVTGSKLIAQSRLDTARFEPARSAVGCRGGTLPLRYMDAALQCGRGDSFTFKFTGTTVGMVRAFVRDGGRLACTVDGQEPRTVDFFDAVSLSYSRSLGIVEFRGLASGDHTLACQVSNELISTPAGVSTGNSVTIGAFLVSDERPVSLP